MEEKELDRDQALGPTGVEDADASAGVVGAGGIVLDDLPLKAPQLRRSEERRDGTLDDILCVLQNKREKRM